MHWNLWNHPKTAVSAPSFFHARSGRSFSGVPEAGIGPPSGAATCLCTRHIGTIRVTAEVREPVLWDVGSPGADPVGGGGGCHLLITVLTQPVVPVGEGAGWGVGNPIKVGSRSTTRSPYLSKVLESIHINILIWVSASGWIVALMRMYCPVSLNVWAGWRWEGSAICIPLKIDGRGGVRAAFAVDTKRPDVQWV